ncbi:hypothetical protein J2857_005962 [Neorhizobium galegae]|uniref:hypothetical protein n=1 Tax=Neorhizobium galegae TaxID=399 RepID=UPI001AE5F9A9|nr:hypothetical protein [Neorhizobium galegae]
MMRVGVLGVEERDDLEAALVDVEVDVSLLEIRRMRSPGDGLRIVRFNGNPGLVTQTMTVLADFQEKQIQRGWRRLNRAQPAIIASA